HDGEQIQQIRRYDPLTQRSVVESVAVVVGPASELILPEDTTDEHRPGLEHHLPDFYSRLTSIFELLPGARLIADPETEEQWESLFNEIADAYAARRAIAATEAARLPAPPSGLYLDQEAWAVIRSGRRLDLLEAPEDETPPGTLPRLAAAADPEEAFLDFAEEQLAAGLRVCLCGPIGPARNLAHLMEGRIGPPRPVPGWRALRDLPPGSFALMEGALPAGFISDDACVVAPRDVRRARPRAHAEFRSAIPAAEGNLRPGDAVIHMDHGIGILRGVEAVAVGASQTDTLVLEYAGGARQLVPAGEADRLWRYGAEEGTVSPDHLGGGAWPKRRAEVETQIAETARTLVRMAREREQAQAPVLRAPQRAYERFVSRFPYELTPDQEAATEAVLEDLRSGRPMDRLVCGDVGFGKTEVALRAAAVAVLAGKQVALMAPTTVLVRQHLSTFRRRFRGFGVRLESLSRLSKPAEARAAKAGLADGSIGLAIGTQALAGKGVRFKDLGLLIVDEEQRFGTRQKSALRRLRGRDKARNHALTLTATPIPRTLQSALAGLQDLSIIATPPARREAIRTFRTADDDLVLREALLRERRRNGQSFVICPRIEDIAPMSERLHRLTPELHVIEAHGKMPPDETDEAMVRFADGEADVLLSTNIVETGLDVPRANTMLIFNPERFGLSQLHQLRGRVGRGRVRGVVYLLTDPARPASAAADRRLRVLEAFDRVGAGFAISARDLDLRGAGDLLGEQQAGHVKL
ncbi:MAG: DEAD/DEAH box helicase, partial [Acetobacteraceae bacterium]|nr:DEAD/DEAH box helicase [Acetobacteraceae bacterium]